MTSETGRNLLASLAAIVGIAFTLYQVWRIRRRAKRKIVVRPAPDPAPAQRSFSDNELELANALASHYVLISCAGETPDWDSLGRGPNVRRALIKINREKIPANSSQVVLPLGCAYINPLATHLSALLRNIKQFLPDGEKVLWHYDAAADSAMYRDQPEAPIPRSYREEYGGNVGDALVVATLGHLQQYFLDGALDFASEHHVSEAAGALAHEPEIRDVVTSLTLDLFLTDANEVPVAVPRDHPVGRIIKELLSTQLTNILPADLHSIDIGPGVNKAALWPKELPEEIKTNGFRPNYLEEILEWERRPDPKGAPSPMLKQVLFERSLRKERARLKALRKKSAR